MPVQRLTIPKCVQSYVWTKFFLVFLTMTGLSEDESIDEDDNVICSHLGKSRINRKAVLSKGREVAPDIPSGESASA